MLTRRRLALTAAGLLAAPAIVTTARAQAPADSSLATIDALLSTLYGVISGPAEQPRDWDRFRGLFWPGARLMPLAPDRSGGMRPQPISPDSFAAEADRAFRTVLAGRGFFETETARRTERFGALAHVFSRYDNRFAAGDATPSAQGINSLQLAFDGQRWWILGIAWQEAGPNASLPPDGLPPAE